MMDTNVAKAAAVNREDQPLRIGSEMVYVYIDDQSPPIQVHRNVVLRSSKFFQNALNGAFKESWGLVNMKMQRRELVEIYVEWLYFGVINPLEADGKGMLCRFLQLYELYILADMLQDETFANAIMNALIMETDASATWPKTLTAFAWTGLPESSPMRKYLRDMWVSRSSTTWFNEKSGDIVDAPKDFWIEIAHAHTLIREKKEKAPKLSWSTRCKYHSHSDGKACV